MQADRNKGIITTPSFYQVGTRYSTIKLGTAFLSSVHHKISDKHNPLMRVTLIKTEVNPKNL